MEPLLDRALFARVLSIPAIRCAARETHALTRSLGKNSLFHHKAVSSVRSLETDESQKLILLTDKGAEAARARNMEPHTVEITLGYENFSVDEALRQILPPDLEVPSSFETVGHLAHLNLRPEYEPYKRRIAQVIIDKSPNVKTVVNKTADITNTFRTFPMEVLVGEPNFDVQVKAHGLTFEFNYAKVYWNSRLSDEHARLVHKFFKPGDVVLDAFCGVGPFAIRAAKAGCAVLANDLNPDSHLALLHNLRLNKVLCVGQHEKEVPSGQVKAFNMDAREFLRLALGAYSQQPRDHIHVVMNLPASAPEFLDALLGFECGLFVHCYCFAPLEDAQRTVAERFKGVLGFALDAIEIHQVRDVSPKKIMWCAHFRLPSGLVKASKRVKAENA